MTKNPYTQLKNDSVGLLAKCFKMSPEDIQALSSSQIKELCTSPLNEEESEQSSYKDNTLEPVELDGSRIELPIAPPPVGRCEGVADSCESAQPEFVDILYIPVHPKTNEKAWYAVSRQAKEIILQEKALLQNAVTEDSEANFQQFNKLGILSKFASKAHEQFMEQEEAEEYRALLLARWAIQSNAITVDGNNPNTFLRSTAKLLELSLQETMGSIETTYRNISVVVTDGTGIEDYDWDENTVNQRLRLWVISAAAKAARQLEINAEHTAHLKTSDDGSRFVYDEELQYFTSRQQKDFALWIDGLRESRPCPDEELIWDAPSVAFLSDKEKASDVETSAQHYLKSWLAVLKGEQAGLPGWNVKARQSFEGHLKRLNQYGFVIKEQCLRLDQLEGKNGTEKGPKALKYKDWRSKDWLGNIKTLQIHDGDAELVGKLYEETFGNQYNKWVNGSVVTMEMIQNSINWAYYPTKALIELIDATIIEQQSNLSQVLGEHGKALMELLFTQLLWVKQMAQARLNALKFTAQNNAQHGQLIFPFDQSALPATFTLLWDETAFEPEKKHYGGLRNEPGYNNIQVVECALLSDGEMFYLRGPWWYMPEKRSDAYDTMAAGHVLPIYETQQYPFITQHTAVINNDALNKAVQKGGAVTANLPQGTLKETLFWQDSYHYHSGVGPNGETSAYSVDAGAQLFRFTMQPYGSLNALVGSNTLVNSEGELRANKPFTPTLGLLGGISANATLLQGQLGLSFWLPLTEKNRQFKQKYEKGKVEGYDFDIPYLSQSGERAFYKAGCFKVFIQGSVYGLAAATCQLGAKIAMGPADTNDGIGIRGSTVASPDPGPALPYSLSGQKVLKESAVGGKSDTDFAAEARFGVDAFAGVEAGGNLGATVFWTPPKSEAGVELGTINGRLCGSLGVGLSAGMSLHFSHGKLALVVSARLVVGKGGSGRIGIMLDTDGLDDFIDCLLGVLRLSHYRRLSVFGETDSKGLNITFERLNEITTVAFMLGLTVSKVLLMPPVAWKAYKKRTISKEYAPFLAERITAKDSHSSRRKELEAKQAQIGAWLVKLPPETLCNLLNCLLREQSNAADNQLQAEAIVLTMHWLANDNSESEVINQRQWKETLIKMADLPAGEKDYHREWQAYMEQWFRLARFVKEFDKSRNKDLINAFDKYSASLCKNMVLLQCSEYDEVGFYPEGAPVELHNRLYRAYPVAWITLHEEGSKEPLSVTPTREWREKEQNKHIPITQPQNTIKMEWSIRNVLQ